MSGCDVPLGGVRPISGRFCSGCAPTCSKASPACTRQWPWAFLPHVIQHPLRLRALPRPVQAKRQAWPGATAPMRCMWQIPAQPLTQQGLCPGHRWADRRAHARGLRHTRHRPGAVHFAHHGDRAHQAHSGKAGAGTHRPLSGASVLRSCRSTPYPHHHERTLQVR